MEATQSTRKFQYAMVLNLNLTVFAYIMAIHFAKAKLFLHVSR